MTSKNSYDPLGEYCAARDERTITFATPAYRRRDYVYISVIFSVLVAALWAPIVYTVIAGVPGTEHFSSTMIVFVSLLSLLVFLIVLSMYQNTGINRIVLDLDRRTYDRIRHGQSPVSFEETAKSYGLGSPFKRCNDRGSMDGLSGLRVVMRRINSGKATEFRGYLINLVWADEAQPPMTVGFAREENQASDLAKRISEALRLPVLPSDCTDRLGEFCIECDQQSVTFATPVSSRNTMLMVSIIFLLMAIMTLPMEVYSYRTHHPIAVMLQAYLMTFFVLATSLSMALSTGINRAKFNLVTRTYERIVCGPPLLPGAGGSSGLGNLLSRRTVTGWMEEISGLQIEPPGSGKRYGIFLVWADDAQPRFAIGSIKSQVETLEFATELASSLHVPILDSPLAGGPKRPR